ncbi:unnamed protein product [Adineta ricciae]|uniref:F-box domain-containing protein n=1 Tax=Adineta ricciae TaxID=249248 RepID=A0A814NZ84_ADIRI|nr:unnamed protein product [Adineta ricciae]CAF1448322.1 unnamed protein product [Adineta ricciae]
MTKMCTCIETFPVELWLEIFQYLTCKHIALAFGRLNSFFESILSSPQLPTIFRVRIGFAPACHSVQNFEKSSALKIEWIHVLDTYETKRSGCIIPFLQNYASRLINMRVLNVYIRAKQAKSKLFRFCKALPQLHRLEVLNLNCKGNFIDKSLSNSIGELFTTILQHRTLRDCSLSLWNLRETTFDRQYILDLPLNHSIRNLRIDNIDRKVLFDIIPYFRGLQSLSVQYQTQGYIFDQTDMSSPIQSLSFPALSRLKLSICNLTFQRLELICNATDGCLRHLDVDYSVYVFTNHYEDYLDYFDRARWAKLLESVAVARVDVRIHALDAVSKDIISNIAKTDPSFKWNENRTVSSYASVTIKKSN